MEMTARNTIVLTNKGLALADNQSGVLFKSSRGSSFLTATDYITQTLTNIAGVISMSPRSPKSHMSPALFGYPSSPTGFAGLKTRLRILLTPCSSVEVDIFSLRSLSPVSSPVCTLPVFTCAEREFDAEHQRDVNVVLLVIQHQGEVNTRVECANGIISTSIPLKDVCKELDRSGKG